MLTPPRSTPPSSPIDGTATVRVRWGNIVVAASAAAALTVGAALLALNAFQGESSSGPSAAAAAEAPGIVVSDDQLESDVSPLQRAQTTVSEANELASAGAWDDAADMLATVESDLREESGADAAIERLDALRARHALLRGQLDATIEARRWPDAEKLLTTLESLAPLDEELQEAQARVLAELDSATTPKATSPEAVTSQAPATPLTSSGAATPAATTTATTNPVAPAASATPSTAPSTSPSTASRPAPASTKPPRVTAPAPAGDMDINDLLAQLGATLTPAQRAQLDRAVQSVLASGDVARLQIALDGLVSSAEIAELQAVVSGISAG